MSKENLLRITLFVSVLTFNQVAAETFTLQKLSQIHKTKSVKSSIAKILHNRGLDADAAEALSDEVILDEIVFSEMLENLLNGCTYVKEEEVYAYLSREVLFRKTVRLESYDYLLAMVSSIIKRPLDKQTLSKLQMVASDNKLLDTRLV